MNLQSLSKRKHGPSGHDRWTWIPDFIIADRWGRVQISVSREGALLCTYLPMPSSLERQPQRLLQETPPETVPWWLTRCYATRARRCWRRMRHAAQVVSAGMQDWIVGCPTSRLAPNIGPNDHYSPLLPFEILDKFQTSNMDQREYDIIEPQNQRSLTEFTFFFP